MHDVVNLAKSVIGIVVGYREVGEVPVWGGRLDGCTKNEGERRAHVGIVQHWS